MGEGKDEENQITNVPEDKHLPYRKVKKMKKTVGLGFGEKTNLMPVNYMSSLPSNIIELRVPAPEKTSIIVRKRKMKPEKMKPEKIKPEKIKQEKMKRNKNRMNHKDELSITTTKAPSTTIQKNNSSIKRSKQQKRQFKNSPSSLFGNIFHRNILTQA